MFNAALLGIVVVVGTAALAVAGMILVRRKIGIEPLRSFNDVGGNIYQVVGTLYAVLLGLIVVDAMSSLTDLRVTVEQEANSIVNIHVLSDGLPSEVRKKVHDQSERYVNVVINEEWDAMRRCSFSKEAVIIVHDLWRTLIACEPQTGAQQDVRQMMLSEMSTLSDCRRKRLLASVHGVSPLLWAVLIFGGMCTIVFTYFFAIDSFIGQVLMTVIVSSCLSLNVYLLYLYGYPFSGEHGVAPEGFLADRAIFHIRKIGPQNLPDTDKFDLLKIRDADGNIEKMMSK
ncbi:MAG: DUF4239 domain-containing protein [Cyanobacteria bacterium]|nr:DUF4239 domain-containing protein [Cyanobacteriota bacterium]